MTPPRFHALHAAMQAQVDQQFLPGVATALLRGRELVDVFVCGQSDREAGTPLRRDHVHRVFSNTKLVTSIAVMMLVEQGRVALQDPIGRYIPALAQPRVLRPGATRIDDTEPARRPITVHHLMTHTAGLGYGAFDPGTLLFRAYGEAGVLSPQLTNTQLMERLGALPLYFHPGEGWEYSLATDVLGHLIEVVTGQRLGDFFAQHVFAPLGMDDTAFWLPQDKHARLAALYGGVDFMNPLLPGLKRLDSIPYPGAYLHAPARDSGGGGLVSTLDDHVRLLQALVPGPGALLRADTLAQMASNQIPPGQFVRFPGLPADPGRVFGLGSSVVAAPGPFDPPQTTDEMNWGGVAGTLWWINPRLGIAGILMTQRYFGFGNPYTYLFKQLAYRALLTP